MRSTWLALPECELFVSKGRKVRMNRWFSWVKKTESIQKFGSVLLLILMYIGVTSNMYETVGDLPLLGTAKRPAGLADPIDRPGASATTSSKAAAPANASSSSSGGAQGAQQAPALRASVRDSNQEIDKLRRSCANTIHLASCVLANRTSMKVLSMMRLTTTPFEMAHGSQVVMFKTQAGAMRWHSEMANQEFSHLSQAFDLLGDATAITVIGFRTMEHFDARDEGPKLEDGLLADQMVDLSRFLVGNDLLSLLVYAFRPPGRFAAFLHESPDVRSECMQWSHKLWDTLEAAEHDAQSDPWLKSFLVSFGWTQETW